MMLLAPAEDAADGLDGHACRCRCRRIGSEKPTCVAFGGDKLARCCRSLCRATVTNPGRRRDKDPIFARDDKAGIEPSEYQSWSSTPIGRRGPQRESGSVRSRAAKVSF